VVSIMRKAIEAEQKLPRALQLQGDTLVIDESLLMLPPPPPPPQPPPAQKPMPDRFTAAQLSGLAAKLRAAASGELISIEAFTQVMCRLGSASFDSESPLLPPTWLPLGAPAYTKLAQRFCAEGSSLLGWPEVVVALAALEPLTEKAISEVLSAAASIAAAEAPPAEEGAPPPELRLTREQLSELPLWFETGATQPDGYSVEGALKGLLFDLLAKGGKLDMQQLLLYCSDSPTKAFAVLGYTSQAMLSLEGIFTLLHREPPPSGVEVPEHTDTFSRAALARLFTQLKLGEAELAPYGLVAAHPAGAELLSKCVSYTPKGVYELVAEQLSTAGQALKI